MGMGLVGGDVWCGGGAEMRRWYHSGIACNGTCTLIWLVHQVSGNLCANSGTNSAKAPGQFINGQRLCYERAQILGCLILEN